MNAANDARRIRACKEFREPHTGKLKFCSACGFAKALHVRAVKRYSRVHCSSCGLSFGADDSGYSFCSEHAGRKVVR